MLWAEDIRQGFPCAAATSGGSPSEQAGSAVCTAVLTSSRRTFLSTAEELACWNSQHVEAISSFASTEPRGSGDSAGHSSPSACWASTWAPLWCSSPGRTTALSVSTHHRWVVASLYHQRSVWHPYNSIFKLLTAFSHSLSSLCICAVSEIGQARLRGSAGWQTETCMKTSSTNHVDWASDKIPVCDFWP